MATTTKTYKPASDKQEALIVSLLSERVHNFDEATVDLYLEGGIYNPSSLINALFNCPKKVKTSAPKADPVDGIYFFEGTIYKVYKAVHGSGRQCAKILRNRRDAQGNAYGEFVYQGLAVKYLPVGAKALSKEQAAVYGKLYGFCIRCGKTLTDEKSQAVGMGSTCASKEW